MTFSQLELGYYDFRCSNTTEEGFPTIRTTGKYRTGSFFFEITIDKLGEAGHMCFGLGSLNIHQNNEYLPSEKYSSYAYSSAGELYALGEVSVIATDHSWPDSTLEEKQPLTIPGLTFYLQRGSLHVSIADPKTLHSGQDDNLNLRSSKLLSCLGR